MDTANVQGEEESLGEDPALKEAQVRHGQRPAAAIAGRARVGRRAVRPDDELHAVEAADRAAAGGHGLDGHHRGDDPHAGLFGLVLALIAAVEAGDVGARAAHVEADRPLEAGGPGDVRKADHAAGGTGKDAVLAHESARFHQSAGGSEDLQSPAADRLAQPRDVGPQDRVQVGVDHRRVAAGNDLHQRRDLVGEADLREARLASQAADQRFMLRMGIGVQQADGQRLDPLPSQRRQLVRGPRRRPARASTLPVGGHPLVDFHHGGKQRFGLADRQFKQFRPVLVADPQDVAEAAGRDQGRLRSAAREQGIGAPRRAQANLHRRQRGPSADAQQAANALDDGFLVREQFIGLRFRGNHGQWRGKLQDAAGPLEPADLRFGDGAAMAIQQPQAAAGPKSVGVRAARRIDEPRPLAAPACDPFGDAGTEDLVPHQCAVGPPADAVGERAADVRSKTASGAMACGRARLRAIALRRRLSARGRAAGAARNSLPAAPFYHFPPWSRAGRLAGFATAIRPRKGTGRDQEPACRHAVGPPWTRRGVRRRVTRSKALPPAPGRSFRCG